MAIAVFSIHNTNADAEDSMRERAAASWLDSIGDILGMLKVLAS